MSKDDDPGLGTIGLEWTLRNVRRAALMMDAEKPGVYVGKYRAGSAPLAFAAAGERGAAAVMWRDDAQEMGAVNPRFLADALEFLIRATGAETAVMHWPAHNKPIRLTARGPGGLTAIAVVMPVHSVPGGAAMIRQQLNPARTASEPAAARAPDADFVPPEGGKAGALPDGGKEGADTVVIGGDEIGTDTDIADLQKKAWQYVKRFQGRTFRNRQTGWNIMVSRKGVGKTMSHAAQRQHVQSIAALPQMLETATLEKSEPDRENRADIAAFHTFRTRLRIDDAVYPVKLIVSETKEGRKFYDHTLTKIEEPAVKAEAAVKPLGVQRGAGSSPDSIGQASTPVKENPADALRSTADAMENWAKERLKKRGFRLKAGLDPNELIDYATLGAAKILRGAANLTDFSAAMIQQLGTRIKPHLNQIWAASQTAAESIRAHVARQDKPLDLKDLPAMVAKALAEKAPNRTVGRPELANPVAEERSRRFVDAVDELRKKQGLPPVRSDQAVFEEAHALLVDPIRRDALLNKVLAGRNNRDGSGLN